MNCDKIKQMYKEGQYENVINILESSKELKEIDFCQMILGFSYLKLQNPRKCIYYLKSIKHEKLREHAGKIFRYIGLSEYILGNYFEALNNFELSILFGEDDALLWKRLLFPDNITIHETNNIIFRFVGHIAEIEKKFFIMRGLKAYTRIMNFIKKEVLCKKIDIYVYAERIDSLGNSLSYTDNGTKSVHIYYKDFVEHEIAHILFNSLYPNMQRNVMIDEGIATFFNQPLLLSDYLKKYNEKIIEFDILDYWGSGNFYKRMTRDWYYFAGAFVGYLLEKFGRERFLMFIQNESIYNAEKIFLKSPEDIVKEFYELLNNHNIETRM